jgi:sec-independent protein translocase protein TatB
MLFDFGWSEIMLIGVIALVVIGPKDLPKAMRIAGYWMKKARALSQEFHNSVDEVIREAELHEMREQLKKATAFDLDRTFRQTIDPDGSLAEHLKPPELPDFSQPATVVTQAAAQPEIGIERGAAAPARPQAIPMDPGVDPGIDPDPGLDPAAAPKA